MFEEPGKEPDDVSEPAMPEELPELEVPALLDKSPELFGILEPEEELDVPDEIPEPLMPEDDVWEEAEDDEVPELLFGLSPELFDDSPRDEDPEVFPELSSELFDRFPGEPDDDPELFDEDPDDDPELLDDDPDDDE